MSFHLFSPGGFSLLLASSLCLVVRPSSGAEPVSTLPPRTIPYGSDISNGGILHSTQGSSNRTGLPAASRLIGITRPSQYAELRAGVGVPIVDVAVRSGDRVKAGDLLVRLDDRIQQSAVKVAQVEAARQGALSSAQIELRLAEQQLHRAMLAFQRQAGSQFEVDEKAAARDLARTRVTVEQESLERARASLDRALAELEQYTIRAPFDGEVVQIHQKVGGTADRSEPVITIADRRKLNVEMHLPLAEFGELSPGSVLTIQADSPVNRSLDARVTTVSPYVNAASRTFRIELEIDNPDQQLPAGFTVRQASNSGTGGLAGKAIESVTSRQR